MTRVSVVDLHGATGETAPLLDAVQPGLGMVSTLIRVLANAPAALRAFLGLHAITRAGTLPVRARERIALGDAV